MATSLLEQGVPDKSKGVIDQSSSQKFDCLQQQSNLRILRPRPSNELDIDKIHVREYGFCSHLPKPAKVVLVVGETGAGKSTLINAMTNYLFRAEWENNERYKLIVEDTSTDQTVSQTQNITAYKFHPSKNSLIDYCLTIIDTPGFGDTRGKDMDKAITDQFRSLFALKGQHCIDQIHGVMCVVKASCNRLTEEQKYIFDCILELFGRDIQNNIIIAATFADSKKPKVKEALAKESVAFKHLYTFNNTALYYDATSTDESDSDDDETDDMKRYWEKGQKSFEKMFSDLEGAMPVSAALTTSVLNERRDIELIIQALPKKIKEIIAHIDEIEKETTALSKFETKVNKSEDFRYTVTVTKVKKVSIPKDRRVTTCDKCKVTCDNNCICSMRWKYWCHAINWRGNCKICPGKCKSDDHVNEGYIYEEYQAEEVRTKADLFKKYHEALTNLTKREIQISSMKKELESLNKEAIENIRHAIQCIEQLEEIALRPNTVSVLEHIHRLIQQERIEGLPGWERRVEYFEKIMKDEKLLAELKKKDEPWMQKMFTRIQQGVDEVTTKVENLISN